MQHSAFYSSCLARPVYLRVWVSDQLKITTCMDENRAYTCVCFFATLRLKKKVVIFVQSIDTCCYDGSDAHRNKTKTVVHIRQHGPSAWRYHSPSLWLSKASAFSSTAHCQWTASSVKPPNPATTSSVELVLFENIFPLMLRWNWSPHSFCHASTTAILSFLGCLLPLSKAFVA